MKTKIVLIAIVSLIGLTAQAQRKAALHHNGTATMFGGINMYQDAYNAAVNGDTIYLTGGYYPGINLAKEITIIGAGFHPDSTTATNQTVLASFGIAANSKNIHLEGLYVDGSISNVGTSDSITIKRCYIKNSLTVLVNNLVVEGCVINGGLDGSGSTNAVIKNNIISADYYPVSNFSNSWIANNTIFKTYHHWSYSVFTGVSNSLIENNIIFVTGGGVTASNSQNNTLKNNVMNNPIGGLDNNWINNYPSVSETNFFVNFTWSNPLNYFVNNFHLQAPTTYLGADGTEVGIYGGLSPFKEGAVPFNPHIQMINIAPTTDTNGDLQIQIKVAAQEN
ncbi:MAG: hypothetical protein IT232_04690 [Flavobacteriales bacterium]|nr:hypothetical protein [Flavobacteriales bacterium]